MTRRAACLDRAAWAAGLALAAWLVATSAAPVGAEWLGVGAAGVIAVVALLVSSHARARR